MSTRVGQPKEQVPNPGPFCCDAIVIIPATPCHSTNCQSLNADSRSKMYRTIPVTSSHQGEHSKCESKHVYTPVKCLLLFKYKEMGHEEDRKKMFMPFRAANKW